MNKRKRLWFGVSSYKESSQSIHALTRSIRAAYPDPARFPIVINEGRIRSFQQLDRGGDYPTPIEWPNVVPHQYAKRTAYFAGRPGDVFMILDADERLHVDDPNWWKDFDDPVRRVRVEREDGEHQQNSFRLFTIQEDLHHWGRHWDVFAGDQWLTKNNAPVIDAVKIIHYDRPNPRDKDRFKYEQASRESNFGEITQFING